MKEQPAICPTQFIAAVQPLLERKDLEGLLHYLKSEYTWDRIRALLDSDHIDAKKVALLALGLVAPSCCISELAKHLRSNDAMVNEMAEHALWSVWFRCGTPQANHELARGAQALERRDFDHAIRHFDRAIAQCPDFAEPYHQRALALYMQERYGESIDSCQRAVERMPWHFGALASMGHCYAHMNKPAEAVEYYEKALAINPHLTCIRQTIDHLKSVAR